MRPLEQKFLYHEFYQPLMRNADFDAVPMIMLCGQYSTGKTTFIRYLLQRDFPGIRIGPEPTTDRFCAITHGIDERIIPGNALAMQTDKPFTALQKFGSSFLNRLEGVTMNSKFLQNMSLVDTPGVLAGNKQEQGRNYNFTEVIKWFANRSDRILLLFDAHKLDISDEFKRCLLALKGHDDKIRVVLNKADAVTTPQLMRVYGSMMWSLGKVINTPEVMRVYIGSFWDQPIKNEDLIHLFNSEMGDLVSDLKGVPRNGVVRKLNELVKRVRIGKTHAIIIAHLRNEMPALGAGRKQRELIADTPVVFNKIHKKYDINIGDFPNPKMFAEKLQNYDNWKKSFPKRDDKLLARVDEALGRRLPKLMAQLPTVIKKQQEEGKNAVISDNANPFNDSSDKGTGLGTGWAISSGVKAEYDNLFDNIDGARSYGKISGKNAFGPLKRYAGTSVQSSDLKKVWDLADNDKDGHLDSEEFAIALYLIDDLKRGRGIPDRLSKDLLPPSQRSF